MSNGRKQAEEINGATFEVVWENIPPQLIEEANNFWRSENALCWDESVESRATQLLVVARDADNRLIAVSTAARVSLPALLDNTFYYLRCFVSSQHRDKGLAMAVCERAVEHLHQRFVRGEDTVAKGFFSAVESAILKQAWTQAVRVVGGMNHVFIGIDERGRHLFVGWFDGAEIH